MMKLRIEPDYTLRERITRWFRRRNERPEDKAEAGPPARINSRSVTDSLGVNAQIHAIHFPERKLVAFILEVRGAPGEDGGPPIAELATLDQSLALEGPIQAMFILLEKLISAPRQRKELRRSAKLAKRNARKGSAKEETATT